jgi:hypothetical protein
MTVFWDIAPFSLVEIGRRFRGVYCLHRQVRTSETSVYFNKTTRRHFSEDYHFNIRENLKSHNCDFNYRSLKDDVKIEAETGRR